METVTLELGERSYQICLGDGLLSEGEIIRSKIAGKKVFILTNQTVASLYLDRLKTVLEGFELDSLAIQDGESFKTLDTFGEVITHLLSGGHNRQTTIIALGGGVIGDLAGFVSASFQRGVPYIQIPTTLLSQVDSSVGGKTAVNHPLGKNMIGAFWQPKRVIIDVSTLRTLPSRELSAGMAEVIKHGAIADPDFFSWLETSLDKLMALETEALVYAVKRNCEIKAVIVAADEKEAGVRALLNFGHTFGHAIEKCMGYGEWLHGEAVGAGLVMAADLSKRLGYLDADSARRIKRLVVRAGLPDSLPQDLEASAVKEAMRLDKKADDQGVRFVLLKEIGNAFMEKDVPDERIDEVLRAGSALCED